MYLKHVETGEYLAPGVTIHAISVLGRIQAE